MEFYLNGRATTLSDSMTDDLPRAVINSLFSWRRAEPDDDLPGESRFGWWGDSFELNDKFGSRLWLLSRAKLTEETLLKAKEYCEEALQWLIDDGVATSVDVTVTRNGVDRADVSIEIAQPKGTTLSVRFQDLWRVLSDDSTTFFN